MKLLIVIPAKAGIQVPRPRMDPRVRGDDGEQGSTMSDTGGLS
jgi:hypothetical protein